MPATPSAGRAGSSAHQIPRWKGRGGAPHPESSNFLEPIPKEDVSACRGVRRGLGCPEVSTAREMDATMAMSSEFTGQDGQGSCLPGHVPGRPRRGPAVRNERPGRPGRTPGAEREAAAMAGEGKGR